MLEACLRPLCQLIRACRSKPQLSMDPTDATEQGGKDAWQNVQPPCLRPQCARFACIHAWVNERFSFCAGVHEERAGADGPALQMV